MCVLNYHEAVPDLFGPSDLKKHSPCVGSHNEEPFLEILVKKMAKGCCCWILIGFVFFVLIVFDIAILPIASQTVRNVYTDHLVLDTLETKDSRIQRICDQPLRSHFIHTQLTEVR